MYYNTIYKNYLSTSVNVVMSKMRDAERAPLDRIARGNSRMADIQASRQAIATFRDRMVGRSNRHVSHNAGRQAMIDTAASAYDDICRLIRSCGGQV